MDDSSDVWRCQYVSDTEAKCDGYKVTLYGDTVTWKEDGNTAKMVKSGQESYNRIDWETGSDWLKSGNVFMNDSRTLLYYFIIIIL